MNTMFIDGEDGTIIDRQVKLCFACNEIHEIWTVRMPNQEEIFGRLVEYDAIFNYCYSTDEFLETEEQFYENLEAATAACKY